MNISEFFVTKRPIAWTALAVVLVWGAYAYIKMPQRQDPIIPVVTGVIVTRYPGAEAEKVEQEVTRKIERKIAQNPAVEHVKSISRPGVSIVYVELFETERNAELVWQDVRGKLSEITDLPQAAGQPTQSILNKDFGDSVAVMLTISSPPVSDLEIELRARSIRDAIENYRAGRNQVEGEAGARFTGILVYPATIAHSHVLRMGRSLAEYLTESGTVIKASIIDAPGAGMLDVALSDGKTRRDLEEATSRWEHENGAPGEYQPDIWPPFWTSDLANLETELRRHAKDKYTYRELKDFADRIRDRLKQSPFVAQIDLVGAQDERVWLYYSGQRLGQFGITPLSLVERIKARNINIPGGMVELPSQNVIIRPTGEYAAATEIGDTVLDNSEDGYPLYLRDLVDITSGYEDPSAVLNFRTIKVGASQGLAQSAQAIQTGQEVGVPENYTLQTGRAITLSVRQVKGTHIADYEREISSAIDELKLILPPDLQIERTSDEPQRVHNKITGFNRNLIEAIVIVVLVSLLFMEWRSALLIAFAIPITVAMTLGFSQVVGIDLQQVSIAALIIALGLLVDAPVVAADAINREIANGEPRARAAWLGPKRLARAVFYATLTNVVAFLPLLLVKGKTGDFIYSLPIVVSFSLLAAMIVAWTFAPLIGFYLLKGQKGFEASEGEPATGFPRVYKRFVESCIEHRYRSLVIALGILIGASLLVRMIGTSFFPKDLHDVFVVNLDLPEGSPIRKTREVALDTIRKIDAIEGKRIRSYTTFVGAGGPRFWLSIEPEQRSDNYAQILVHTVSREETSSISEHLKSELPLQVSEARVRTQQLETGPPIGIPVQVRLYGPDIEKLRDLASQLKAKLRTIPGTIDIHDDWGDPVFQMSLKIDPDRAALSGVTNQDIAATVATGLSGLSVSQIREKDKLIDLMLRLRPSERSRLDELYSLNVVNAVSGTRLPLRQVAVFEPEIITPKIRRRDHERCITVRADTRPGVLPSAVVGELEEFFSATSSESAEHPVSAGAFALPPGYRWEFGGEKFEQDKGFNSLTVALIVSFLAIYLALVLQFNSVTQPLLLFAAVPFGVVGGLLGLLVFGSTFGFMAFLGVASLAGLIISHVIVLFDFIDEMRHKGEPLRKAVVDAGLARLRPVVVTVLAAVGGLIPLALDGGPLWEPMCYVQIFGMLVATVVTLVFVPVLYVIFVEDLRLVRWDVEQNAHAVGEKHT